MHSPNKWKPYSKTVDLGLAHRDQLELKKNYDQQYSHIENNIPAVYMTLNFNSENVGYFKNE